MTRNLLPWLPWLLLVGSCSSPPKLPTVDESRKRPANTAQAVELQSCRSDLDNLRIVAADSARSAEASHLLRSRIAQLEALVVSSATASAPRNVLIPVLFDFGSSHLSLPEADKARIVEAVQAAPLVVLRGRTDGAVETAAESAIARQRAATVESWLVQAGVDRSRIRSTWQPIGDHAADNTLPGGRALNRRVEIEVYRAAPLVATVADLHATPQSASAAR
jgi:outer membrane protein OmpA-like peptidoglycan-associated protein